MIQNILENNGFNIALSGILVVFAGLIIISLTIYLFNLIFATIEKTKNKKVNITSAKTEVINEFSKEIKTIPEDELVAIAVAVECYRKIHFEIMQNEITFTQGNVQNTWKLDGKFKNKRSRMR